MLKPESKQAVDTFLASAKEEFAAFADQINSDTYEEAAAIILESQKNGGRLHITGIGKPGHVSAYMASLLSSTGNPCYFLHGTEAVHGSCGQLVAGDVVIAISNSGETSELKSTVLAVKNNGCKIIGVSGKSESWLMVGLQPSYTLYFKGTNDHPSAFIEVSVFGSENKAAFSKLTAAICDIFDEVLSIPADRVYVKYNASTNWGWNGSNF